MGKMQNLIDPLHDLVMRRVCKNLIVEESWTIRDGNWEWCEGGTIVLGMQSLEECGRV